MTQTQYKLMLRFFGLCAALVIGGVSLFFSQDGFNITVPGYAWIGWILACTIPVIEMIWNHEKDRSNTLFIAGIAAYIYGFTTNVIGLLNVQGYSKLPWDQPWLFVVPCVIGFFLEWVPEPLLQVVLVRDDEVLEEVLARPLRSIATLPARPMPTTQTPLEQPVAFQPQGIVYHPASPAHLQGAAPMPGNRPARR